MSRPTLLIDADDTLWSLIDPWTVALNEKYNLNVKSEDITDWDICRFYPTLTKEQVFAPLEDEAFYENVRPYKSIVWLLYIVYAVGCKIKVVTSIPKRHIKMKADLLFRYFPYLTWENLVVTDNKQEVDGFVLIDDRVDNLLGGKYRKILITKPHNKSFKTWGTDIVRVTNTIEGIIRAVKMMFHTRRYNDEPLLSDEQYEHINRAYEREGIT